MNSNLNNIIKKSLKGMGGIVLAATMLLATSCNHEVTEPVTLTKTHSVQEFLDTYMTELGTYFPVRTRSYVTETANGSVNDNYGLFSLDSIPSMGNDIVIEGRVVSDDFSGNLYKTMVIQDSEHPEQGLRISVDAGSMSGIYVMGQLIRIRCNGLCVGKYAFQPQLAVPAYNNNTNAQNDDSKVGWAPGRIPYPIFTVATELVGAPDASKIVVDTMTITEIKNITAAINGSANGINIKTQFVAVSDQIQALNGRLVCIKDVHFTREYDSYGTATACTTGDPETDSNTYCFAPTTNNQGFPQGRYIADSNGNKILVSSSEFAKFANFILPETDCTGTITGIVGFYYDRARYGLDGAEWSITIRSLDDLDLRDANGNLWTRTEWTAE